MTPIAWEDIQDTIDKWAAEALPGPDAAEARACIMSWSDLIAQAVVARIEALSTLTGTATPKPEGAAEGWWIEEREDDAFIVAPHWNLGKVCVARRPKLMSNDAWRSIAEQIVRGQVALSTAPSGDGMPGMVLDGAIADIAAERRRQVEAEGWTPEHDDKHDKGELARAAGIYALIAGADATAYRNARAGYGLNDYLQPLMDHYWPWLRSWFKATIRRRDLVKAGALIVAEIDRLDRATKPAAEIEWTGSEDQQQAERHKACDARCRQDGVDDECDRDGSCAECEMDMAEALRLKPTLSAPTFAWLIERREYAGRDWPHWYVEEPSGYHWWTPLAHEAKQFASKAEAEAYPAYQMIASDPAISVTEHLFVGSEAPAGNRSRDDFTHPSVRTPT